jgi:hypothetical protein
VTTTNIKPPQPARFTPVPRPRNPPTWLIRLLLAYSFAVWVLVLWVMVTRP